MKKIFAFLAIIALGLTMAGCVDKKPSESSTTEDQTLYNIDTEMTQDVTITFWEAFGKDKEDILKEIIADFETANPHITVELASQGTYDDLRSKAVKAIVTGDTPDVILAYPDHVADYLQGKAVIPLDPYMNNPVVGLTQDEVNDFVPSYLQENQQFGKTYGLPFNKSTEVFIYNKTIFDKYHLSAPTTWDQVKTDSQTIVNGETSADNPKWGFSYDSLGNMFITMTRQWGGEYTDSQGNLKFDNDSTKAALAYYKAAHDAGLFTIPAEWEQSYSSTPFVNQQVYMTVGSIAGISYNIPKDGSFEVGIAPVPYKDADHNFVIQQGTNLSIMANTNSQERLASWLLIKYLTSPDATVKWAMGSGYLPVRKSAYQSDTYQAFLTNPDADQKYLSAAANAAYAQTDHYFYDPAFVGSSNVRAEAENIVSVVLFGGKTPQQAIDDAITKLEW